VRLGELGEFGLISRIAAEVGSADGVVTGIGDDAAVTSPSPGMQLLTSTDMLLEGVHFRCSWHKPYPLGRKSLAVSLSDIAAMGGIPCWALFSLAIPTGCTLEFIDEVTRGFLSMAAEHGVTLIGGDTCSSRNGLVISVTIMGEQAPELIVRRSGACPGDDIWVTGTLGDAALGLKLLEEHSVNSIDLPHPPPNLPLEGGGVQKSPPFQGEGQGGDGVEFLVSRLLDPTPRIAAGRALAESGLVTAMIDVSDGLLADFGHIAEMSAVGGSIRIDAIPVSPAFSIAAQKLPTAPHAFLLAGGEEYELCFTAPVANREKIADLMKNCGVGAVPVGIVTNSPGVTALLPDGTSYHPDIQGFNHFR